MRSLIKLLIVFILLSFTVTIAIPSTYAQSPEITPFSLEIQTIKFFTDGDELQQIQSDYLRVYRPAKKNDLEIRLTGKLYGENQDKILLETEITPANQIYIPPITTDDEGKVMITIKTKDLPLNEFIPIHIQASLDDVQQDKYIQFILNETSQEPRILDILLSSTFQNQGFLALFMALILTLLIIYTNRKKPKSFKKLLVIVLMLGQITALFLLSGTQALRLAFSAGLLDIEGQEIKIQTHTGEAIKALTLTRIDENLRVVPSISSSWSNINPVVWEFILREDTDKVGEITGRNVIKAINESLQKNPSLEQYLSSVEDIVSINNRRLQFITKFPDPLLAQKLSKIDLSSTSLSENARDLTDPYLTLEYFPDHSRDKRNERYFGLPFLNNTAVLRTKRYGNNLEALKESIKNQRYDIIDDPDPSLWPYLSLNGYTIIPKINTNSIILLANRNNPIFAGGNLLRAMRKILHTGKILQTSYFQYGQLANQFAPPGVIGYFADIDETGITASTSEIIQEIEGSKEEDSPPIELTLNFPEQEGIIAKVIQQEFRKENIYLQLRSIPSERFQASLGHNLSDLILLPLQFDMGDIGPFLDTLIDSKSPLNSYYKNDKVDQLILQARSELNRFRRIELLNQITQIIVNDDPAGIPLLFKKSFYAKKQSKQISLLDKIMQKIVLGW